MKMRLFLLMISMHEIASLYSQRFTESKFPKSTVIYAKPKPKPKQVSKNVENYIRMREYQKLKEAGAGYEDIKSKLSSSNQTAGYQKFLGKGTLDQRLRAIIAYKKESGAVSFDSDLSLSDKKELDELDDDYFEDDLEFVDDEDLIYETLIQDLLQKKKLEGVKSGFQDLVETPVSISESESSVKNQSMNSTDMSKPSKSARDKLNISEEDWYTPANPSWGIFQRPRNFSKAYGGGRVITPEQVKIMNAIDEEKNRKESFLKAVAPPEIYIPDSMKLEKEHMKKIEDVVAKARTALYLGDRKTAISRFESIQDLLSYQSDYGGEILLELGMALETVPERVEEARKVYAKLASTCWSSKVRRQAVGLLQGLDIVKQLRPDISVSTAPTVDYIAMGQLSQQLRVGLTNEWDEYKKKSGSSSKLAKYVPWYEGEDSAAISRLERVDTLRDAYYLLLRVRNPLKKVPSESAMKACRLFYYANDTEKLTLLQGQSPQTETQSPNAVLAAGAASSLESTSEGGFRLPILSSLQGPLMPAPASESSAPRAEALPSSRETTRTVAYPTPFSALTSAHSFAPVNEECRRGFGRNLNGTWELILSIEDKKPFAARRYDSGALRRSFLRTVNMVYNLSTGKMTDTTSADDPMVFKEEFPTFWGIFTSYVEGSYVYNYARGELTFTLRKGASSASPRLKGPSDVYSVQVLWADEQLTVTRQAGGSASSPDLYTVWKKLPEVRWKKY